MIGVLTHHWAKADKIEEAKTLLDGNGLAQSKAPGFGSRQTLISLSDPTKISTLVTWDSNEIYDAWRASPERAIGTRPVKDVVNLRVRQWRGSRAPGYAPGPFGRPVRQRPHPRWPDPGI